MSNRSQLDGDEHRAAQASLASIANALRTLGESVPYGDAIRSMSLAHSHVRIAAEQLEKIHRRETRQARLDRADKQERELKRAFHSLPHSTEVNGDKR